MSTVHLVTSAQWPAALLTALGAGDCVVLAGQGLSATVPERLPCPIYTLGQSMPIEQLAERLVLSDRSVTW